MICLPTAGIIFWVTGSTRRNQELFLLKPNLCEVIFCSEVRVSQRSPSSTCFVQCFAIWPVVCSGRTSLVFNTLPLFRMCSIIRNIGNSAPSLQPGLSTQTFDDVSSLITLLSGHKPWIELPLKIPIRRVNRLFASLACKSIDGRRHPCGLGSPPSHNFPIGGFFWMCFVRLILCPPVPPGFWRGIKD